MGYRNTYFNDPDNKSDHGWYTCAKCGKKIRKGDADIDHIVPQSYGGGDNTDNLQITCRRCNRSKGNSMDDTMDDFKNNMIRKYG